METINPQAINIIRRAEAETRYSIGEPFPQAEYAEVDRWLASDTSQGQRHTELKVIDRLRELHNLRLGITR